MRDFVEPSLEVEKIEKDGVTRTEVMESVWRLEDEWRRVRLRLTWGEVEGRNCGEEVV